MSIDLMGIMNGLQKIELDDTNLLQNTKKRDKIKCNEIQRQKQGHDA